MLKDAIVFACRRSFSYRAAHIQNFTTCGSVHSYSSAGESMDSDSDSGDDDGKEIDNGTDNN